MYDLSKLRGRIIEKFGSLSNFAEKLGKDKTYLSRKMQGHSDFSRTEIIEWSNLLEIDSSMYEVYFFTEKI